MVFEVLLQMKVAIGLLLIGLFSSLGDGSRSRYVYNYRFQKQDYDFYGEYIKDTHGFTIYVYCYDPRTRPEQQCRPRSRHNRPFYNEISDHGVDLGYPGFIPDDDRHHNNKGKEDIETFQFDDVTVD